MKLTRLRVENFKRFRAPYVLGDLSDGLNLFVAPNEAGKSTLAEAIRAAFLERHSTTSLEHLRPWGAGSSNPRVEVDFEHAGKNYQLTKSFLGPKQCDLRIDASPLTGKDAEDELARLIGFKFPGKGATAPEHMGIPGLLWIAQGTSHELADPVAHAAPQLQQVLGASLGDLAASGGDALLLQVEGERNELLSPKTDKPKGPYAEALAKVGALATGVAELDDRIATYKSKVDQLARMRHQLLRDEAEQPWVAIQARHQAAVQALDKARGLKTRHEEQQRTLEHWQAQVNALTEQSAAMAREEAAVEIRAKAVETAQTTVQEAHTRLALCERRHQEASDADTRSQQVLRQVSAVAVRAELSREVGDLAIGLERLEASLTQAREQQTQLTELRAQAAALSVPAAELKRLQQASDELRDVNVRLEVVATTIDLDLIGGRTAKVDGETLAGQVRRTVTRATEIEIESVGRIVITPGGADLGTLTARQRDLEADIRDLLARLGVTSVAQAVERNAQSKQRLSDAQACEGVLTALAPQGVDALDAERTARQARLAERRAALERLPAPAEGDAQLPNRDTAQAQAEHTQAELAAAAEALNQARMDSATALGKLEHARQELESAQAVINDPQRAARQTELERHLVQAMAQVKQAQADADALREQLASVNLDLLTQDVEQLANSASLLVKGHEALKHEAMRLQVELDTLGALGLEEQRAEQARDLELAQRRADELARHARALDHLLRLLQDKKKALTERLHAPLQKHLDHYLKILFPGASMAVADNLAPGAIVRLGPTGPESGLFEDLSVGAREQIGIVARVAYADLLQAAQRPTLLILDDALVHTDEDRLGQMKRVLYDAANRHQILIFTCHPAAWRDLGAPERRILG